MLGSLSGKCLLSCLVSIFRSSCDSLLGGFLSTCFLVHSLAEIPVLSFNSGICGLKSLNELFARFITSELPLSQLGGQVVEHALLKGLPLFLDLLLVLFNILLMLLAIFVLCVMLCLL